LLAGEMPRLLDYSLNLVLIAFFIVAVLVIDPGMRRMLRSANPR
jgi:hypothetical protein